MLDALQRAVKWLPVVIAPLLGGTAERPYTMIVAALCGLAGLWAAGTAWRRREVMQGSWFAVALLLAVAASLLQCVPLPPAVRAVLAPGSEGALRQVLRGLDGDARWIPLSVDAGATANEVVRLLGYLCLLMALGSLLQRRGDSVRLGRVIVGSASLVAALGGLAALGVPLPAPCAVPAGGATRALLPAAFYNSNHMAALLSVGAAVTVGVTLAARGRGQRALGLGLLALQDLALLGTLSRAGILVGIGAQLTVLAVAWRAAESSEQPARRGRLGLLVLPVIAAAALLWAVNPGWLVGLKLRFLAIERRELLADGSKVTAWLDALPLLRGHWVLGVGRGAFEAVFASYHRLAEATRFVYLENEWLQAAVDWGVPVAVALLGLCGLGLRDAWRGLWGAAGADGARALRSPVRLAALMALAALAVANCFDFNLEVGGVAVAAVALLALGERPRFAVRPHWGIAAALATILGSGVVWWRCPAQEEEGARLRELAQSAARSPAEVVRLGTQMVRRHPLDSYLSATVAARLQDAGDAGALLWVDRALAANPRDLGARRTLALMLAERGHRGQALRTLGLAIFDGNRPQRQWLYATALQIARTPAELLVVLPEREDELPRDLSAGILADELLEQLSEGATVPWPLVRAVAEWGQSRGAQSALGWLGRACLAQRDEAATAAVLPALIAGGAPPLLIGDLLMMLLDTGHVDEVERLTPVALLRVHSPEVLLAAALLQERRGHLNTARELLDTAQSAAKAAERAALEARVHEVRAALEARAGNLHRAELEREAAARLRP